MANRIINAKSPFVAVAKIKAGSFKERLKALMLQDGYTQPYKWAKAIGIKGGLFQYYWQKGKIPTVNNLLKIQKHTGCSIDWLLTGKKITLSNRISGFNFKKSRKPDTEDVLFFDSFIALKKIYNNAPSQERKTLINKFLASMAKL